ncbi:hypothetical protein L7F22_015837 [Adiantum nelumboides]|nr:hypothetical protein [Adiantum nelumboides]
MSSKDGPRCIADQGFSSVCAMCHDNGDLIWCGQCGEGFHMHCLNGHMFAEQDAWLCHNCKDNKVQCFECKDIGSIDRELFLKCTHRTCKRLYHQHCTLKWRRLIHSRRGLVCPQHVCDACGSETNSGQRKLFRCLECSRAYHERCCLEDSLLLKDIPGYMICWRHENLSRCTLHGEKFASISAVFESLPVADFFSEFEVPRSYRDFVRDLKLRPQPFVQIKRNIYLVKKPKRRPEDEYMQCACASTGGSKASCERDCICSMLQYSCSANCGCGSSCSNLPFQKRLGKKLELTKTERCGWGLQAAEPIKAGDFLIEYVGEVIDDKTCEERLWGMKERGESNFYMCEINRETVVDATIKGNISRFINHSCNPNTELQKWQIDEELRIGVFAISDIREGEPILYDYQFIPFGQEQDCFCGASGCRGKLGRKLSKQKVSALMALKVVQRELFMVRQTKRSKFCGVGMEHGCRTIDHFFSKRKLKFPSSSQSEDNMMTSTFPCIGRRVQIWWHFDQKYYYATITEFDNQKKTHKVVYDNGQTEVLDMEREIWELDTSGIQMSQRSLDATNICASEESFAAK